MSLCLPNNEISQMQCEQSEKNTMGYYQTLKVILEELGVRNWRECCNVGDELCKIKLS